MKRQDRLEKLEPLPLPPSRRSSSHRTHVASQGQPLKPPAAHMPDSLSEYFQELDLSPTTPMHTPRTQASHIRQRPHTAIDSRRGIPRMSAFSNQLPSQTALTKPTARRPRSTLQPLSQRTNQQSRRERSLFLSAADSLFSTSKLHADQKATPTSMRPRAQAGTPQGTTSSFTSNTSRRPRTHATPLTPLASSDRPYFHIPVRRPRENAIMAGSRQTNTESTPRHWSRHSPR